MTMIEKFIYQIVVFVKHIIMGFVIIWCGLPVLLLHGIELLEEKLIDSMKR